MRTIKFDAYEIKIGKIMPGSNYNTPVSLFKKGERLPECGQIFKESVTDRELLQWAFDFIDNPPKLEL